MFLEDEVGINGVGGGIKRLKWYFYEEKVKERSICGGWGGCGLVRGLSWEVFICWSGWCLFVEFVFGNVLIVGVLFWCVCCGLWWWGVWSVVFFVGWHSWVGSGCCF